MSEDAFGDRMKLYEMAEAGRRFMPLLPIMARVDGRAFHSFTKGMKRPFDPTISEGMIQTAKALADETGACMVYTQSDEISLAWHSTDIDSQVWFDGRICKMTSQLAALATLHFYRFVLERMSWYAFKKPSFDARCWQVPNRTEGANVFLWREWDATKNSLSMAASTYYSHTELHGKNGAEKHDMLHAKGINWNDYPASFKRGTYIQRRKRLKSLNVAFAMVVVGLFLQNRQSGLRVRKDVSRGNPGRQPRNTRERGLTQHAVNHDSQLIYAPARFFWSPSPNQLTSCAIRAPHRPFPLDAY